MPMHQYINLETMEQIEEFRTWDQHKKFLEENPSIVEYWSWKAKNDPSKVSIGGIQSNDIRHKFDKKGPSKEFQKFLKKVQKDHPGSNLNTWRA